jgi:Domain of unknown function (DUF4331)
MMSNHFSTAYLKFPGDDARLDLTDLFIFTSSASPGRTALIIDVNPFMMGLNAVPPFLMKAEFHPDAVYRINVDNDGNNQADAAFMFVFSEPEDGTQAGTAYYVAGAQVGEPDPDGDVLAQGVPVGSPPRPDRSRPARPGGSSACAGTRSSPMPKAPSTVFSGLGKTRSPTRTCSA